MLQVANLSKSYGEQVLFDGVSFNVNAGERIGLVGRNGTGKSTLFRILLGEEAPDAGVVTLPKKYSVGHLDQHIRFEAETVLEEVCRGLPADRRAETWNAEKLLMGLGFSGSDFARPPGEFSGGFQVRIKLARVLASDPNLLLLDEPTNYLDIVSLRWLSRFLQSWKKELLLITHDRGFMDDVCTHTMGIHRRRIRKIDGGTEKLYEQILKEEEVYEKTRVNDEKRRKEIETFITRFRAKARLGGLVQSRVKLLAKQEKRDRLEKIKTLDFSFAESAFTGKWTLEAEDIRFSYDGMEPWLIGGLSIRIGPEDRIGVIGKNGKGKSTLLKLLSGEISPVTGGVKMHPQASAGYFAQTHVSTLFAGNTVLEEIQSADPDRDFQKARDIAGAMMFEGDAALKRIGVLSGGEKSRVMMGRILARPTHLLLLDEPTNHLDLESCDSLIAALDSYAGAVVIVTHNEMYLDALVNRLVVFDQGTITVFEGTYREFLERVGWESEAEEKARQQAAAGNEKKIRKKERAQFVDGRNRVLRPLQERLKSVEEAISRMEAELHRDSGLIVDASTRGDGAAIADLSKKIHDSRKRIDALYGDLVRAADEYEREAGKYSD